MDPLSLKRRDAWVYSWRLYIHAWTESVLKEKESKLRKARSAMKQCCTLKQVLRKTNMRIYNNIHYQ